MKTTTKTISDIIFQPTRFFRKISHHGIKEPFKFLIIMSLFTQFFLVYHILRTGFEIPLHDLGLGANFTPELNLTTFLIVYVAALVWTLFFGFLWPAAAYLFIKMYNKKAKYRDTYKSIIYSGAPVYVTIPFYIILIGTGFGMLVTKSPLIVSLFVVSLIIQIIAHAYTIYLKLMSISRLQHISMMKSFLCIYVFPTALLIVAEFVIILLVVSIHYATL
ncbi:MAG: YIP1 family protein [Nanoarchaeota archaeon]|nr:YIP1 family protein [Nanoarchaeota archaeon]